MNFQLTQQVIKMLCGELSFKRGQAYYRAGKVAITRYDPLTSVYEASVNGSSLYQTRVEIDDHGHVKAQCTCPSLVSYDKYCKHVAAVLLYIKDMDGSTEGFGVNQSQLPAQDGIPYADMQLANGLLELFNEKPKRSTGARPFLDSRTPLEVEFICKPFSYGSRKHLFGIEMKIGTGRLYIVKKIREFLENVHRREAFMFSRHFSYDPSVHCFQPETDAVIQQLIKINQNERIYRETANLYLAHAKSMNGERMLLIPPSAWDTLLPLLAGAPLVKLEQGSKTFDGIEVSRDPLPIQFEFDQALTEGYRLNVEGLEAITIMESYGVVIAEGKLVRLPEENCRRLSQLQQMFDSSHKHSIKIGQQQMEPLMEKVIPGLMKLGQVRISQAVASHIVQTPLKAKLYLDRVKNRLLAGLEFHYGDIVINPLEGDIHKRGTNRILMRDGDQERQILELMEKSSFVKTDSGYFTDDEEAEYDFLYHIVPQLEHMVDVYATSAVKVRLHTAHVPPKLTINFNEKTDWLDFQFEMEGIPESEIRNVLKALNVKRKYYRLPNGSLLPLESAELQEIIRFMNEIGISKADLQTAHIRLPVARGLHAIDSHQQANSVKLGKSLRRLLENMRNPDNLDFPVPLHLEPVLRDYQKEGFQWMKTLAHYRFGGILADDMGLGKTLQSIAFIVSVLPEIRNQDLPAVIVCPASLVYNWRNELHKFAPEIRAVIADGSKAERNGIVGNASNIDVIITSYPLLRRDIELYTERSVHTLILDEAQAFKNHTTQTAQAVRQIQAKYRFALTGTPVENSLEELWSIFNIVFPELLPSRKVFNDLSRETVAKRIRPFLLRRLKTEVLKELPEKIESLQASELLPEQKKLYIAYLAELQKEALKHLNEDSFQKNRIRILAGLTRLRQVCCHPALFVEGYNGSSAKFEQLLEMIEECRSAGKRMLVFSQFTEMLGLIGRELGYQGVPYFYLDGKTPAAERVELCSRFNQGERDLFLISLKAGGTGLNLTGADTVILYDLWWNPAVEQQAADRAHRIGQKNVVQVIRLVAQGTVEDKMYALQQKKKNLIEEVIQPGQDALSSLTEQEIREILMI